MLPDFRYHHCSSLWRITYIVCAVLVCSYIFFDVLDLDGSDFPLKQHPLERTAIVAEVAKDTVHAYSLEKPEFSVNLPVLSQSLAGEATRARLMRVVAFAPLDSARTRGYRVALPRSSPSDPFGSL
ncbi:MAG TPA: hypothetical protein VLX11_11965 [Candidatus Acidoferrales bacterium]|nr:hypothetical protein [Candidatus Acidoferrales bacterium]